MARIRNIKPGFFENEVMGQLPFATQLMCISMYQCADREGRMEDLPIRIKAYAFRYRTDVSVDDVDGWLGELAAAKFITRYESGGVKYISINNFGKHQYFSHKEPPSVIPAPPSSGNEQVSDKPRTRPRRVSDKPRSGTLDNNKGQQVHIPQSETSLGLVSDSGFLEFWKIYPRKVGKPIAKKAWNNLPPESMASALAGAQRMAARFPLGSDLKFCPHPTTWIHRAGWDDEDELSFTVEKKKSDDELKREWLDAYSAERWK